MTTKVTDTTVIVLLHLVVYLFAMVFSFVCLASHYLPIIGMTI